MNDIIPFAGQKVAKAFAHLDPRKSLGDGIMGGFSSINYRGKVWSLRHQGESYHFIREDDGTPLSYLDVIIVGVSDSISKVYYPPGEWDEDSAGAPVCASLKGDVPDPGVPEPQSRSCGICKNNQWTTLPNGRKGKACQDHKRAAVLLMPAVTAKMLGSPLTEPVFLKVPPGSLTSLKNYGDSLSHQGYPFAAVITRISFSPDKLFQMIFKGLQLLTDKEAPVVLPLIDDPRTMRLIGDQPVIQEVRQAPAIPDEKIETGILDAFGGGKLTEVPPPRPIPARMKPVAPVQQSLPSANVAPETPVPLPPANAATAARRPRGRPPKVAPAQQELGYVETQTQPEQPSGPKTPMWGESSPEMEQELSDLLSKKVADML